MKHIKTYEQTHKQDNFEQFIIFKTRFDSHFLYGILYEKNNYYYHKILYFIDKNGRVLEYEDDRVFSKEKFTMEDNIIYITKDFNDAIGVAEKLNDIKNFNI